MSEQRNLDWKAPSWQTLTNNLSRVFHRCWQASWKGSFIVLACWLTLAICVVWHRHDDSKDVFKAEIPSSAGEHKAGAGGRLGRGGDSAGSEEIGRDGVSDHPQWTLHGVLAPHRAPPEERLRFRHCQQANLSDVSLWQGEHVASLHRRFTDQTIWVHDSRLQVSYNTPAHPVRTGAWMSTEAPHTVHAQLSSVLSLVSNWSHESSILCNVLLVPCWTKKSFYLKRFTFKIISISADISSAICRNNTPLCAIYIVTLSHCYY